MTPSTPIESIDQLKEYLYVAMKLEHATIPPYLTAAYTAMAKDNMAAQDAILAVAREEMLHLTLAGNLLNAIGGTPDLLRKDFVVRYPCFLPDGETDFQVSIASLNDETIDAFLAIERPTPPMQDRHAAAVVTDDGAVHPIAAIALGTATAEANSLLSQDKTVKYIKKEDLRKDTRGQGRGLVPPVMVTGPAGTQLELHYWSIGEFYNAIRNGFEHLADQPGPPFTGDPNRQIPPPRYFSAGGALTKIVDLESAKAALDLISSQGEGYVDEVRDVGHELAHFYRFEQIKLRKYYLQGDRPHDPQGGPFPYDDKAVYPILKDAKLADYKDHPEVAGHARRFNGLYRRFLYKMNAAFNGQPELFETSYADMFQIRDAMGYLVRTELSPGRNAAPTFEMDECSDPPDNAPYGHTHQTQEVQA